MGFFKKLFKKEAKEWSEADFNTSLSDTKSNDYPSFCARAASEDSVFATFRTNPIYMNILEHVSIEMGQKYLDEILKSGQLSLEDFEKFRQNDFYGGAAIHHYEKIGDFSPSTLRYIKVLADLKAQFGDLNGKDIVEVGIGYGGQSRVIMALFSVKSYTFVDLDSVLSLAKKYLSHFDIKVDLYFLSLQDLEPKQYDLFMSNYAFSELRANIQEIYAKNLIHQTKNGYITYNNIAPKDFNYPLEKYAELTKQNLTIKDEIPNSHPLNKIVVW